MKNSDNQIYSNELFDLIEPILKEGKSAVFYVSGMSMWPFICHGRDSVIIKSADSVKLRIGDIVLIKIPGFEKYMLHRIVNIDYQKGLIQTAGDGNCFYDGWFPLEIVVAIVTNIIYKGRIIPVNNLKYRFFSTIWRWMFPIRKRMLKTLRKCSAMKKKIKNLIVS